MWQEFKSLLERQRWITPLFVFFATFAYSSWFYPTLAFPDGDSFYHIKMTELLARGIPRSFPWLPFTALSDTYIDHHFLYHVFLFPFVHFLDPFIGAKLATIILAASAITVFYLLVRVLGFVAPGFFTIMLALAPGFFFRMNLVKAPVFSLLFVFTGLYFLIKRHYLPLAITAFVYVWAYGGWPLLPFIAVIWILARSFMATILIEKRFFHNFWKNIKQVENIRLALSVGLGALLGLVINPFFPRNLAFYLIQFVKIAVINYQSKISVGAEWLGAGFAHLFGDNLHLLVLGILGMVLFVLEARRRAGLKLPSDREQLLTTFALIFMSLIFFLLTVRSIRMIDYFFPIFTLAIAALFTLARDSIHPTYKKLVAILDKKISVLYVVGFGLIAVISILLPANFVLSYRLLNQSGYAPHSFGGAINWLKNNVEPQSIVFHTDWDNFPELFYEGDNLRFITGLDSTFLYDRNPELYWLWEKLVRGEQVGDVAGIIHERFQSSYVFITKNQRHNLFELQMRFSKNTQLVYEDDGALIFKIISYGPSNN